MDIPAFAKTQLSLLAKELQAELDETSLLTTSVSPAVLQRAGLALSNLQISNQRTGMGGKTVVELALDTAIGTELPEHGFRVGDIVGLREQVGAAARKKEKAEKEKSGLDGVVTKVRREGVEIALDRDDVDVGELGGKIWMVKLANDVTYKRMNQTMKTLQAMKESEQSNFIRVVFGQSSPTPVPQDTAALEKAVGDMQWIGENLNDSQKAAIKFAMASREIALIHGPPGTGKTHTLIELILQLLKQGKRLLVCGPSNISVDNIVERLSPHKVSMVRLGHPARLLPTVLNHSLEVLTKTSEAAALVQDIRKEMDEKQASIKKTRSGRERKEIYGELKELRKEFRERERGCVDGLVRQSKVVLTTLHGAGGHQLKQAQFDVVIIDEASQALEAQCWVPLLAAKKAILAGDHLQLPPTIKSLNSKTEKKSAKSAGGKATKKAANAAAKGEEALDANGNDQETHLAEQDGTGEPKSAKGDEKKPGKSLKITLETTLFDRLLSLHGEAIKCMLTTQYRMHDAIMSFPSSVLYEGKLVAAPSVAARLLCDLPGIEKNDDTSVPLVFYDTQGGDFPEKAEDADTTGTGGKKSSVTSLLGDSKSNEHEAAVVGNHVAKLIAAGLQEQDLAVITPYNAQLAALSQLLKERYPGVELGSVDGFQGREKEAVIVTLVRSNDEGEVGFLGEKRRLNVAMTRPKRHLCIVGDGETVAKGSRFLADWVAYLEAEADLRYPDPSEVA